MSAHAAGVSAESLPWTAYRVVREGFASPRVESAEFATLEDAIAEFVSGDDSEVSIWLEGEYPGYGWMELDFDKEGVYRESPDDWWDSEHVPTGRHAIGGAK